jgi:hypothetical protein
MKTFIVLLIITLFVGCGKKETANQDSLKTAEQKKDTLLIPQSANDNKTTSGETKLLNDSLELPEKSPVKVITFDIGEISKLPEDIKYTGRMVAGVKWKDKLGENVLIVTETEEKAKGDFRSKELYGYHFIIHGNSSRQLWKVQDFVKDCEFDLTLEFIKNSLTITDLDSNNIAETCFMYKLSCRSDVSPNDLKLIMHEGDNKFAIRGTTKISITGEGSYGGEMKIDAAFNTAPIEFADFAKKHWKKFNTEKY